MDTFRVLVILVGLVNVALLAALVWRLHAFEKRFGEKILRSLGSLERYSSGVTWPSLPLSHHHRGGSASASEYFVYWQWMDGVWRSRPEMLPPGADPGLPPAYPGAYQGQVIKTWMGRKE